MSRPGRKLTPRRGTMGHGPPGLCATWGCVLPVGPHSVFGPGPECIACKHNLRPAPLTEEENEKWNEHTQNRKSD